MLCHIFSFSDESELQVQEFLYKDKLQLCSCFVEISGEFFPLYILHSLLVNCAKIAVVMHKPFGAGIIFLILAHPLYKM